MGAISISEILVTKLDKLETNGGEVLHAIKSSDSGYVSFGEAYFSSIFRGSIRAWKRHKRMTMNLIVPIGEVKFVFCSVGEGGVEEFRIERSGLTDYSRITVPPGIWFGFQGISTAESLVLNVASIQHDPDEVERLPLAGINYEW